MTERATVFENVQLGRESTAARGVAVPADRLLQTLMIVFSAAITGRRVRPSGNKLDTKVAPGRRSGEGSLEASAAAFGEVCDVLESIFGTVAPTTPGGATLARERRYSMNTRGPDTYQSYTLEKGSDAGASRMTHALFTGMTMNFGTEALEVSGSIIGRLPERGITMTEDEAEVWTIVSTASGGTFTITIDGQTTSALTFDESAADISTALIALSNVAPGDITVAGGDLVANPVTLTFELDGAFAGMNPVVSVDDASATGGEVTITETNPGILLTSIPLNEMDPLSALITVDDSFGAIGTTVMERVLSGTFSVNDKYAPLWVVNRLNGGTWPTVVERPVDATLGLVLASDSQSSAFLDRFEAGDIAYTRISVLGPEIEVGFPFLFQADLATSVENLSEADQDDVWADTWGLRMVDEPNIAGVEILVRNDVEAL